MVETALSAWKPANAWTGLTLPATSARDAGVRIALSDERGLADLIVINGQRDAFVAVAARAYGVTLGDFPRAHHGRDVIFIWAGPDHWMVSSPDVDIAVDLARYFAGLAAVINQNSSRAAVRVSGTKVREALAKGVLVDLHPRAFNPGDVALTSIAHIGALLWQIDDAPTYEILVFRSLAESFWHWLAQSAAPFGMAIEVPTSRLG